MKLSKALFWRAALALLTCISLVLMIMIWQTGEPETQDAFFSGRRLIVHRETGIIQGKPFARKTDEEVAPVSEKAPEAQPVEEAKSPPESKPEEPQETAVEPAKPVEIATEEEKPLDSFNFLTPPAATEPAPVPDISAQEKLRQEKEDEAKVAEAIKSVPILSSAPTLSPSANALPDINKALTESSEQGTLPMIGPDGTKPWKYYSKPSDYKKGTPAIAIIVTGLGQNRIVAENAVRLPENISLSFSPYARDTTGWGKAARMMGHEMLIDLPMEPSNYPVTDPGPHGLLIEKGPQENEKRLEWVMSRYPTAIGFITPQNERFSSDVEGFKILLQSIANRGLLIALGAEPHKTETKALVEASSTPLAIVDMLIDEELSANGIQTRLTALEALAKKRGYAVGIVQPYPISIEQLRQWSETLKDRGIVLVPVSAIAKLRFS